MIPDNFWLGTRQCLFQLHRFGNLITCENYRRSVGNFIKIWQFFWLKTIWQNNEAYNPAGYDRNALFRSSSWPHVPQYRLGVLFPATSLVTTTTMTMNVITSTVTTTAIQLCVTSTAFVTTIALTLTTTCSRKKRDVQMFDDILDHIMPSAIEQ